MAATLVAQIIVYNGYFDENLAEEDRTACCILSNLSGDYHTKYMGISTKKAASPYMLANPIHAASTNYFSCIESVLGLALIRWLLTY